MAVTLVATPGRIESLATADGELDDEILHLALVSLHRAALLCGLLAIALLSRLVRAGRGAHIALRWVGILGAFAMAIGLGVASVLVPGWWASRIDLIRELDPGREPGRTVHAIATAAGRPAALDTLGARLLAAGEVDSLVPLQVWFVPADSLRHYGKLVLDGRIGAIFGHPAFSWRPGQPVEFEPPTPAAMRFHMQRQVFLLYLLFGVTGDEREQAARFAMEFQDRWTRAHPAWPRHAQWAWDDDPTGNRAQAMLHTVQAARETGVLTAADELEHLRRTIIHGRRLMDERAHNYVTNHGLMQNAAQLSLGLAHPELKASSVWIRTAVARMERYVREQVTEDGVSRELAPEYHHFIAASLLWFEARARAAGIRMSTDYESRLRRMLEFSREILYPDQTTPRIADSAGEPLRVEGWPWPRLPAWPELRLLRESLAKKAEAPAGAVLRLWEEAGYFVIRQPAGGADPARTLMLTMMVGPVSTTHYHHDRLSITLFGHGRRLLTGPGYPSFFDEQGRETAIATPSQNTVSVDGGSQALAGARVFAKDLRPGEGRQTPFALLQAGGEFYRGVEHRRTVAYGASAGDILLVDELRSDGAHDYRQHFHTGDSLTIAVSDGAFALVASASTDTLLSVSAFAEDGQGRPIALAIEQNGPLVSFGARGTTVRIVTTLGLAAASDSSRARLVRLGDEFRWSGPRGSLDLGPALWDKLDYSWAETVSASQRVEKETLSSADNPADPATLTRAARRP